MSTKAVIVLSGGLDSTTCMGMAKELGYELYPITFYYQQRHSREIEQSKKISKFYGAASRQKIVDLSFLGEIGSSALTDSNIMIRNTGIKEDIPETYVPARNLIFLSLATAYAEVLEAKKIWIGVNAIDYSGYPDCRLEFIQSMTETIRLATKWGVTSEESLQIEVPLLQMTKAEIIKLGIELGVPYELTTSCYQGSEEACGICDSCILRLKGFAENHIPDPISYQT